MKKLKPVDHLKNVLRKKGLERLTDHYKIKVKTHPEYPNLHLFKYNQIESPMGSAVVQACRGIILDADDDWKTICHTYDKFFNVGEGHAAEIDWNTAKIYEKLDGSLCSLWHYDNQWNVSTSGMPDAGGMVNTGNISFKDLFWKTWEEKGYKFPLCATNYCAAFELMTPFNRVVVPHKESRLVCHGIRNLTHDYEECVLNAGIFGWDIVKQWDFEYTDEITDILNEMDGMTQEGFVVVDGSFNRIKMKCDDYVRKHHLVSSFTQRNILDAARQGEREELISYFPDWEKLYDEIKEKLDVLALEIEGVYNEYKGIKNQKDFALKVGPYRMSGTVFALRSGKSESVREALQKMNIKHLEKILGLKEKEREEDGNSRQDD